MLYMYVDTMQQPAVLLVTLFILPVSKICICTECIADSCKFYSLAVTGRYMKLYRALVFTIFLRPTAPCT